LNKTVVKLLELSEDEEARMIYEAEVKAQRDERARMRGAREEGKAEGERVGRIAGVAEVARKLIAHRMPVDQIAAVTALSHEEIEKLCVDSDPVHE
jgi:predicted transposase/invertase (TIGR01784 family)